MPTCADCGVKFEKTNKRGPAPKSCPSCRDGSGNVPDDPTPPPPRHDGQLTLRDIISVAELPLSAKQCDVVIEAFIKARARAMKKERDATG